jgi:two-component system chemotaxis response regulator CheY
MASPNDTYRRVLIADDDLALLNVLDVKLRRAGYLNTRACDGKEAWSAARKVTFDLILSDYNMPKLNGAELFRQLREVPAYQSTPFLLMSGRCYEFDLASISDGLNIRRVIAKPISLNQVLVEIQNCFEFA